MMVDISNFYLMTPIKRPEYICIHIRDIPDEIIVVYKIKEKSDAKWAVYIVANSGMYGLPQSGLLANIPWKTTQQTRLPTKQISPRDMETQMATSTIHTGGGQFQREIHGGETCTPPQANTRRKLHSHNEVTCHNIHWDYTRLVLHAKRSAYVTTRIHQEIPQTIQPQTKEKQNQPKNNFPRNHHQRHCLTKGEINLLNKCAETFCL